MNPSGNSSLTKELLEIHLMQSPDSFFVVVIVSFIGFTRFSGSP